MRAALATFLLATSVLQAADITPPPTHELRTLQGFTVLVHKEVLEQPADGSGRKPLDVLELEFSDLKRVAGPRLIELLRSVPVWVRWDWHEPSLRGAVAVYYGGTPPDGQPLKANCIEIVTLKRIGDLRPPGSKFQQIVTLHEMSHAVQHRLLGMDATEVKSAFDQAVERRLYDEVSDRFGQKRRAYARTNAAEYFAELSCAFLDSCHYYPFTYSDLKVHDPVGFALMESVWKHPERFAGRQPAVTTAKFSAKQGNGVVAFGAAGADPASERAAYLQLDRARSLARDGKKDEAQRVIDTLLNRYPDTLAAEDAKKLSATLR